MLIKQSLRQISRTTTAKEPLFMVQIFPTIIKSIKTASPPLAVFTLVAFAFAPAFVARPDTVLAKPHFSIPGLRALQRKLHIKTRRRRKHRPSSSRRNNTSGTATDNNSNNQIHALPPLPTRNPRHIHRRANAVRHPPASSVKWKRRSDKKRRNRNTAPARIRNGLLFNPALPPLPTRKPHRHPSQITTPEWTPKLIHSALEQCERLGISLKPLPPVKKGQCGNPAPVLLDRINIAAIKPAATLSCPMVASLQAWFSRSVQPLALEYFGKKIVRIRNISSYVCRNRYGDTTKRISEHAYANALDIAWFELQGGEIIKLATDWNAPQNGDGSKSRFLHAVHKSACKLFGTVLGPDANAAHKNHFHLDRAPRKRSNYCK